MARHWILIALIVFLGGLTVSSPFVLYAPDRGDGMTLEAGWRAIDEELVNPELAAARARDAREVMIPDFMSGQSGADGAFGTITYIRGVSGVPADSALVTGKIRSVYRYYAVVDGDDGPRVYRLGGNGDPSVVNPETSASAPPKHMLLDFGANDFTLVLHVANTSHFQAGLMTAPVIRDAVFAQRTEDGRLAAIMLFAGLFIAIGLYTILLALWHAGESYYYSGGVVLVLIAIRLIFVQDFEWLFLPFISYPASLRFEYVTFFTLLPMFYGLACGLFPKEASVRGAQLLFGVSGLFALVAIAAPLPWVFETRNPYMLVAGICGVMVLMVFLRARNKRRLGANVALAGWAIMIVAMLADAVLTASGALGGLESVPVATIAFAVILMWLFTMRYRREQAERTALSKHLAMANEALGLRADELDDAQQRAEDALRIKSSFLANISHEVRTPLNAIIGFSDLLISQSHSPVDAQKQREYLSLIRNNGQQLLVLMSDILSVSDLEAGRFEVAHDPFDPQDVVDMSVGLLAPVAREKHIFLDTQCQSIEIQGDVRIMRQALIKVLSNAMKHAPDNGVVTVHGALDENHFTIRITDTGAGMPKEEMKVALSVFERPGHAYTSDPNGGMSVGLPLVSRLMTLIDGRLDIESIEGVGTTVTLGFPVE